MDGPVLLSAFYFVVFTPAQACSQVFCGLALHTPLAGFGIVEGLVHTCQLFFCFVRFGLLVFVPAVYTRGFLIIPLHCICFCFVLSNNFAGSRRRLPSPSAGSCILCFVCTVHPEK